MSAVKHTPGPWVVGYGNGLTGPTTPSMNAFCGGSNWAYEPVSKGMETIAVCPIQAEGHKGDYEANARLIAAAPELLDAVLEMMEACGALNGNPQTDNPHEAKARAAIKKATGSTS